MLGDWRLFVNGSANAQSWLQPSPRSSSLKGTGRVCFVRGKCLGLPPAPTRNLMLTVKNFVLLVLTGLVVFFISRDWINVSDLRDGKPEQLPASTKATAQASTLTAADSGAPPEKDGSHAGGSGAPRSSLGVPLSDAQKVEALGSRFEIRVAVDKLAEQWERRRHSFTHNEQTMQQTGEKEFALLVRRIQGAGLYAERALEDVVRSALKHERPAASAEQREILLDGIFQTMRANKPKA